MFLKKLDALFAAQRGLKPLRKKKDTACSCLSQYAMNDPGQEYGASKIETYKVPVARPWGVQKLVNKTLGSLAFGQHVFWPWRRIL